MTSPVPRDPLGLRHSRPTGFDSEPNGIIPNSTIDLVGRNKPKIKSIPHRLSAQDDSAEGETRVKYLIAKNGKAQRHGDGFLSFE